MELDICQDVLIYTMRFLVFKDFQILLQFIELFLFQLAADRNDIPDLNDFPEFNKFRHRFRIVLKPDHFKEILCTVIDNEGSLPVTRFNDTVHRKDSQSFPQGRSSNTKHLGQFHFTGQLVANFQPPCF